MSNQSYDLKNILVLKKYINIKNEYKNYKTSLEKYLKKYYLCKSNSNHLRFKQSLEDILNRAMDSKPKVRIHVELEIFSSN